MANSYVNAGQWQAGWTSDTAHLVVGMAARHGNARYAKVRGKCGQSFCPGATVDSTAAVNGVVAASASCRQIALCGKCLTAAAKA